MRPFYKNFLPLTQFFKFLLFLGIPPPPGGHSYPPPDTPALFPSILFYSLPSISFFHSILFYFFYSLLFLIFSSIPGWMTRCRSSNCSYTRTPSRVQNLQDYSEVETSSRYSVAHRGGNRLWNLRSKLRKLQSVLRFAIKISVPKVFILKTWEFSCDTP